jgi:hypothetical protein
LGWAPAGGICDGGRVVPPAVTPGKVGVGPPEGVPAGFAARDLSVAPGSVGFGESLM